MARRIEIQGTELLEDGRHKVNGRIVEITSVEQETGGAAATRPVTLILGRNKNGWLIEDLIMGEYEVSETVSYKNPEYGFIAALPKSWAGFSVATENWEGLSVDDAGDTVNGTEKAP